MNKEELLEYLRNSDFPSKNDVVQGLQSGSYLIVERERERKTLKVKNFLGPIRSKIEVLKYQYKQTDVVKEIIVQSEHLVKVWSDIAEENCELFRIDINEELFYFVHLNPDSRKVYGVLLGVNKGYTDKHIVSLNEGV